METCGSVAPLFLDPGVEFGAELVGGAADGLFHVFVVVAGADRVAVPRARFKRTALVVRAALDWRIVVRQEHLEPGDAGGKAPQVLLDHLAHALLKRVGAVNLVICVQLDLQSLSPCLTPVSGSVLSAVTLADASNSRPARGAVRVTLCAAIGWPSRDAAGARRL